VPVFVADRHAQSQGLPIRGRAKDQQHSNESNGEEEAAGRQVSV